MNTSSHARHEFFDEHDFASCKSLLHIVPDASGDVVLSFAIDNYIKSINPDCHIKFATLSRNLPLARLCPDLDEVIEISPEVALPLNRKKTIASLDGIAESTIYTLPTQEDFHLLAQGNLMQCMWQLAGLKIDPVALHLKIRISPADSLAVSQKCVLRCLRNERTRHLIPHLCKLVGMESVDLLREKQFNVVRIKKISDLIWHLIKSIFQSQVGMSIQQKKVIISTHAKSIPPMPKLYQRHVVKVLRAAGFQILHNVLHITQALPGTTALICDYEEFCSLRDAGVPFLGWRSGLCDIAAAFEAPMVVLYPCKADDYPQSLLDIFGFHNMNVALNVTEFVCKSIHDLKPHDIVRGLS